MESVNHPSHYQGSIECIDGLESILTPEQFEGFLLGNALKYLWRAGKKGNKLEDYRKAEWYLKKLIDNEDLAKLKKGARDLVGLVIEKLHEDGIDTPYLHVPD